MCRGEAADHGGTLSDGVPFAWRLRAIGAVVAVPPLLEVVSFARIERMLTAVARAGKAPAPDDAVAAAWVDAVLHRLRGPWAHSCLRRASILYYLLRSTGRVVDLCIGVRRDEHGELRAHAWLVRDGEVYLERGRSRDPVAQFTLIAQFPQLPRPQ